MDTDEKKRLLGRDRLKPTFLYLCLSVFICGQFPVLKSIQL
jgi:hypothetical protein